MVDSPVIPLWKKRILERVMEDQAEKVAKTRIKRPPNGGWFDYLRTRVAREFKDMVHQAAKKRNISYGAYVRRAVAKQVAKDLGIPWEAVLRYCPYPTTYGQPSAPPKSEPVPDDGTGYGDWT